MRQHDQEGCGLPPSGQELRLGCWRLPLIIRYKLDLLLLLSLLRLFLLLLSPLLLPLLKTSD